MKSSDSGIWELTYTPPTIFSVVPLLLNTSGGNITITGVNFGLEQYVTSPSRNPPFYYSWVLLTTVDSVGNPVPGVDPVECVPVPGMWRHRSITCVVPPAVVAGMVVTVNVSGQAQSYPPLDSPAGLRLRFAGPYIGSITRTAAGTGWPHQHLS